MDSAHIVHRVQLCTETDEVRSLTLLTVLSAIPFVSSR